MSSSCSSRILGLIVKQQSNVSCLGLGFASAAPVLPLQPQTHTAAEPIAPPAAACVKQQPLDVPQVLAGPADACQQRNRLSKLAGSGTSLLPGHHHALGLLASSNIQQTLWAAPLAAGRNYGTSSASSSADSSSSSSSSQTSPISASCDVPPDHPLNQRQQHSHFSSSSDDPRLPWPTTGRIKGGSVSPEEFWEAGQVLSDFYQEGVHGGLGRRFRRKVPLFQVIEFHANGTAVEEYKPRTPQQLGLHPRDVVLFAPLSRLAAPQRATIVVHDGKILVKTEIVKAIITADKAVLIKGRRDADTQKLSQNILAANDQRLMAINLHNQQQAAAEAARAALSPIGVHGCGKAASAADLIQAAQDLRGPDSQAGLRGLKRPDSQAEEGLWGYKGQQGTSSELKDVPFEMLVLEVLLDATTEYFYTKVQHLNWMLESIAADIRQPGQPQGAMDKAHQLIPIQRFLTSVKNDVKETSSAIKAALANNETLHELCLSWHQQQQQNFAWVSTELQRHRVRAVEEGLDPDDDPSSAHYSVIYGQSRGRDKSQAVSPTQQVRMLTEMLESYEREIQSLEGSINEAEEDLDNTRSLWHMQLDSSRNHIIMVNLWLSMVNISVMASTILPAFFGMNLNSPLPTTDSTFFFIVCGGSLLLSGLSYPASRYWYTRNWRKMNQNKVFEQKMLRVLLVQNIEDVDQILRNVKRYRNKFVDRSMFRQLLMDSLGNRAMTPTHIDFLWQCFDRDRDGFISEAEMIRPLNTYHSSSPTDSYTHIQDTPSSSGSSSSSSSGSSSSSAVEHSHVLPDHSQQQQQHFDHEQQQQQHVDQRMQQQDQEHQQQIKQLEQQLSSWESLFPSEQRNGSGSGSDGSDETKPSRQGSGSWDEEAAWVGPVLEREGGADGQLQLRRGQRLKNWIKQHNEKRQQRQQVLQEQQQLSRDQQQQQQQPKGEPGSWIDDARYDWDQYDQRGR